jgi:hypothetical protein
MRSGRSFSESVFSIKPLVIKTALERVRPKDFLFYFDADMFFFKSIIIEDDLFREYSVYLSKHIFRSSLESHSKYGVMNAGFVGFQKNDSGRDALDWWLARCNEECSIRSDGETYADQKYLEVIPKLFEDCKVFADLGINQGMWAMQHDFAIEKGPRINGCEITCFHFHGLRVYRRYFAFTDLYRYGRNGSEGDISKFIYSPYFRQLEVNYEFGRRYLPDNFPSIRQLLKPGSIHFLIRKRFTCGSSGILFS